MSEIQRFIIHGPCVYMPAVDGEWIRYNDHRAEVERLTNELNAHSEVNRRLILERDVAEAEVDRLNYQVAAMIGVAELAEAAAAKEEAETDRVVADGNRALAEVERLTIERDAAQAEAQRLAQELDGRRATNQRIIAERDAAQRERERLQDLLKVERLELSTLRDRLRVLQTNPSASLTSSRPTDEDIWREAFMQQLHDYDTVEGLNEKMDAADSAVAFYRKRWPR